MNTSGFKYSLGLLTLLAMAGLACGSPTPTAEPAPTAATEAPAVEEPGTREWVTFTDEKDYFAIEVPADWEYLQTVDDENSNWYWDVFTAPDGHARIESIVYDDGSAWTSGDTDPTFRSWLHQFYGSAGQEGDILISEYSTQKDGSERLTWESMGGKYSGITYVEVRKPTAGLMFTILWDNAYENEYADVLNQVVESYRVP